MISRTFVTAISFGCVDFGSQLPAEAATVSPEQAAATLEH
jgi:hypothetical protein